jgi:shikimate dehydrogenase
MIRKYGLIGFPLGHSFSKSYFTSKFQHDNLIDCEYENYPIKEISLLKELIQSENYLLGLNVTIPYKEQVIPYLNEIDKEAAAIGAVNTIKIYRSAEKTILKGFNTDVVGFEGPLLDVLKAEHKLALILGTGGASKAVVFVLKKHNIAYRFVSRNPKGASILSYADLTPGLVKEHKLIINTSPVGMYPNTEDYPRIPYESIGSHHILYDLIYNPEKTKFLQFGEEKKATIINGLPMLKGQAERAWQLWNSKF